MHDTAAQRQPARTQGGRIERQTPLLVHVGPATEVTTQQHSTNIVLQATRRRGGIRQCRAERDFVDPRAVDGAGDRKQANAARPVMTKTPVPRVAPASDQRGQREALDVLDQCRPAADTAFERAGRSRGGPGVARIHEVHSRRFLARDVAGRRRDDAGAPARVGWSLRQGVA